MDFDRDKPSAGAQKFDHLADKVRRSVIYFDGVERDMIALRTSLAQLQTERDRLELETGRLSRKCETIIVENSRTHEKAVRLMERLDEFLGTL